MTQSCGWAGKILWVDLSSVLDLQVDLQVGSLWVMDDPTGCQTLSYIILCHEPNFQYGTISRKNHRFRDLQSCFGFQ